MFQERTISAERLIVFGAALFQKVGVSEAHARQTAEIMVQCNLRGVDTHGAFLFDLYTRRLAKKLINATPSLKFEKRRLAVATLDADFGLGQVATLEAMRRAVAMAREVGCATVLVKNSNHFGAAAYYTMHAAEQGCIGTIWSHGESDVVPFGGRQKFFGTNPLSVASPDGFKYLGMCMDMATSEVAFGKIRAAGKAGDEIPANWAVDSDGEPVTQPSGRDEILKTYAAVPMSGAKGYGISVMIELTCSVLTGMAWGPHIVRKFDDWDNRAALGHYVQALDIEAYMPLDEFRRRSDQMLDELKSQAPAPMVKEILIPGEPERRRSQQREREGCPLAAETVALLAKLGDDFGVPLPE